MSALRRNEAEAVCADILSGCESLSNSFSTGATGAGKEDMRYNVVIKK